MKIKKSSKLLLILTNSENIMNKERLPLASAITQAREDAGLTKRELAELIGVTPGHMTRLEAGQRSLKPTKLEVLFETLKMDDWLDNKLKARNTIIRQIYFFDQKPAQAYFCLPQYAKDICNNHTYAWFHACYRQLGPESSDWYAPPPSPSEIPTQIILDPNYFDLDDK